MSRQWLSHWVVEATVMAYECQGLQPPVHLHAHCTRGMATSGTLSRGVSVGGTPVQLLVGHPYTHMLGFIALM